MNVLVTCPASGYDYSDVERAITQFPWAITSIRLTGSLSRGTGRYIVQYANKNNIPIASFDVDYQQGPFKLNGIQASLIIDNGMSTKRLEVIIGLFQEIGKPYYIYNKHEENENEEVYV